MSLLKSIRDYVDTLVHPSAIADGLTASRHRVFIAPRLIGSVAALAAFQIYLVMRGVPSALEVMVFAWLVLPILTAYYLSRTGQLENAHVFSSLALTGLVTAVASETGGIASFAAIWLVVVPFEAALSASRRVVALASTFSLAAGGLLHFLGTQAMLPPTDGSDAGTLAALGIISAALYATGLAFGAESLARTSSWLLYAEKDLYRLLARNMTDVITRHGRNGAVLFVSPGAETLFGAKVSELHSHRLFDRVHVADRPAYLTALADAAALGEARSVEFRVRRDAPANDGAASAALASVTSQFIWVEMRCRRLDPAADGTGDPEVVAVMRDVTERKQLEEALDCARAEADQANASKVKFLANMSHELRTPLNAVIGFSDLLMNEERMRLDGPRRQEYAKLINDSGTHLLSVVNGILDMSKMETGDFEISPEPFASAQVIGNCCDILALKARESGVDLTVRLPAGLPDLTADKRAFKQILLNLVSNAVKFTDHGGRVTVTATAEAGDIVVAVEDTGVGISADDLPRIGQPFFQARGAYDRRHDGTGLGLSIVQGLVGLHGGELNIASRLGEGTRVTVRLPINCETARPVRKPSNVAHPSFDRVVEAAEVLIKKTA
ncbi:MAG: PAS domain-containing sensor histidine kinase [Alphaproteobacteria bacterium]|nr:PAS domain-containing sensor histidine kinase [Alphaproteobacteria bacterium]